MRRSLRIASVRGIDVRLHITFPLILLWAALNWGFGLYFSWVRMSYGVLLVLLLFVCVVLHELGHSLLSMRYGVRVRDITLLPIGGVAQMRRMPSKPWQELLVALAGPAVNLLIAAALATAFWIFNETHLYLAPFRFLRMAMRPGPLGLVVYLILANGSMALFNLLPAFPMDGGRVLRALLTPPLGGARATLIAVRLGQLLAVGFLAGGVYLYNPVIMLVGVFIFAGAVQELRTARARRILASMTAGQAIAATAAPALRPDQALGEVTQMAVFNHEANFPVMQDGRLVGLLFVPELNQKLRELGPWSTVAEAMRTDFLNARSTDTLLEVQEQMAEREADTAEVSDDSGFRGILTREAIGQLYTTLAAGRRPLLRRG